jgi:hypothetical protein
VGVLLLRQVQHGVQRVHVGPARRPVRDPRYPDLPELRHQRPDTALLGACAHNAVLAGHVMPPFLAGGRQVQPVLEQLPQHFPPPHVQLFLQVTVLKPGRIELSETLGVSGNPWSTWAAELADSRVC